MARKVKIPNHILKRFQRQEERREINFRQKRKFYLIVCEGEKTEPNYFESFKENLPKGVLEICEIKIKGTGYNTLSLVKKAQQIKVEWEKETQREVDFIWVVFDRDSFSAQNFNKTIEFCFRNEPHINCAWSNEAFELWYLLHFNFYDSGISRTSYQELIEENLKPHLGADFKYRKNSKDMYEILNIYGNQDLAIRHAKTLNKRFEGRNDFAAHNPCTTVHLLIEELLSQDQVL